jgi:serpin B
MALSRLCKTLVPAALVITACTDSSGPGSQPPKVDALPRQLSTAEQKLITGNNSFAFDLLRTLNPDERASNVFVSPLSASMALGMTMNGADGATFEEMRKALHLESASRDEINAGYKSLIALLRGLDNSTDFRIANSIWYRSSSTVTSTFASESQSFFDATVKPVDVASPASLDAINSWVDEATNKKIPSILDKLDPNLVMLLVNAMYFKASWVDKFDKAKTQDQPFTQADGTVAMVPLMFRHGPVAAGFTADFTVADLSYGNTAYSMTIVLPRAGLDVNQVAESLTEAQWQSLVATAKPGEDRDVFLPRFRITWERSFNEDLQKLGMTTMFTGGADFTRATPGGMWVSKVFQKTFVDVNEEGTEAAAATGVAGVDSAPFPVRIDRPFIFAIRERLSGTILFLGKVVKLPG